MKIKIKDLKNSEEKSQVISFNKKIEQLENHDKVKANLKVTFTPFKVTITGHAATELVFECDRCLEKYNFSVDVTIDEDFVFDSFVDFGAKEHEIKSGQFVEELAGREEIDVEDFLYQIIMLQTPTQKICKPSCLGSKEYQEHRAVKNIDERLEVFKSFSENNAV